MRPLKRHQMTGPGDFLITMLWRLITPPLPRAPGKDIGSLTPDGQDRHLKFIQ